MDINLKKICSVCDNYFVGKGYNSYPLIVGRCCNNCNLEKVLPFKIMILVNREKVLENEKKRSTDYI